MTLISCLTILEHRLWISTNMSSLLQCFLRPLSIFYLVWLGSEVSGIWNILGLVMRWGWDSGLNKKFTGVSFIAYTHSLNRRWFYPMVLLCLCFDCDPSHEVRGGVFHLSVVWLFTLEPYWWEWRYSKETLVCAPLFGHQTIEMVTKKLEFP